MFHLRNIWLRFLLVPFERRGTSVNVIRSLHIGHLSRISLVLFIHFYRNAIVEKPKGNRDKCDDEREEADHYNLYVVAFRWVEPRLVVDAVQREEIVLSVRVSHEIVESPLNELRPHELETLHEGDDLEVVREDPDQHRLRLVSLRVRQKVAGEFLNRKPY